MYFVAIFAIRHYTVPRGDFYRPSKLIMGVYYRFVKSNLEINIESIEGVYMTFGTRDEILTRIKDLCNSREITMGRLEQECGFAHSYFRTIEKQNSVPSLERLAQIAKYFDVSMEYLVGGVTSFNKANSASGVSIPLYSKISADRRDDNTQNIIGEEIIPKKLAETGEFFAWRMDDHTMEPDINMGDRLIVRATDVAPFGNPALMLYNKTVICRIFLDMPSGVMLIPQNRVFSPEWFSPDDFKKKVKILGEVVEARRYF
jgi:SOS-response transcriptional repressor LexA